jgi:hypothetical protein
MNFPDIRKMINICQQYRDELCDDKLKYRLKGGDIEPLIKAMKEKNFNSIKEFVVRDLIFTDGIYRTIYDRLRDFMETSSIPQAILILNQYQTQHNFVIDKEIHTTCMLLDLADSVKFK